MKVTTNDKNNIQLEEVFNPVIFKTSSGEELCICMRDSGFEFTYEGKKYSAQKGVIDKIKSSNNDNQRN